MGAASGEGARPSATSAVRGRDGPQAEPVPGRVALDAMGGDHAPGACVRGALAARDEGVDVVLVGDARVLAGALADAGAPGGLAVIHAATAVDMAEEPAVAVRGRKDASVRVAARLVANGEVSAVVSAGSTGATLAAALLEIGRIDGVRRPALAAVIPVTDAGVVLVDAGGNADVQPEALSAYAEMGVALAQARGVDEPRVGLLNVGAEPGKGSALYREAHTLLSAEAEFAGNVEPAAVLRGEVDVVVADGFTGNVFLKTVEALGRSRRPASDTAAVMVGVAGEVLVAHGAASAGEITAALRTARDVALAGLSERVADRLAALQDRTADAAHEADRG